MTGEAYPKLLSPITVGSRVLKNRIVFASVYTGMARDFRVTRQLQDFHLARARAGVAAIVMEPFLMWSGPSAHVQAAVHGRERLDDMRELAEAVGECGCHLLCQIQDSGRGHHGAGRKLFAVAPSALPDDLSWTVPRAMSRGDIRRMVDEFVESARRLKEVGFAGAELSAGHGHIFHQFLSPWMNHREDDYGGPLENRARFLQETIEGLRAVCGSDFLVGIRLPGDDGVDGSISWADAAELADWFSSRARVDYMAFVQGSHAASLHMHVPDRHTPRGTYVEQSGALKPRCAGVPLAAIGRILEPGQAEAVLQSGDADLVMMARALIADAAWAEKARANRDNDIRKCVSGNSCWRETVYGRPLACDNNPRIGQKQEGDWWPARSAQPRRVVVVGGGVAGLEAAWVAAASGHEVTLFSASETLGGKLRIGASLPGSEALSSIADVQQVFAQRAGVDFRLSRRASAAEVLALKPDRVILASGGTMNWPSALSAELREEGLIPDIYAAIQIVLRYTARQDATAVIYDVDGSDLVYSAAELFAQRFARVVVLTPCETVARDESLVTRQSACKRLDEAGVKVVTWAELTDQPGLENAVVKYRHVFSGRIEQLDQVGFLTYATPKSPNQELLPALMESGIPTRVIGDAYMPRTTWVAVKEGHEAGLGVEV